MNWVLLRNSLVVAGLATLLSAGFGLITAMALAGMPRRVRTAGVALAIIALALPPFLVTNSWLHFLGPTGVWRGFLPLNIMSFGGTVWILGLMLWPVSLLAALSAWQRLEPAQLESDMAVTGWHLFRGLLWPLARPALAQAAVLTFVLALNNFAVPSILQVKTFPSEVWIRFSTNLDAMGALEQSWPMILAPLLLLAWFAKRGVPWPHAQTTVSPALFRQQLGPAWWSACGALALLLFAVSAGLPMVQILSVQRTWTELPGALAAGQSAIWNSLWLSALSATAAVALSLIAALQSRRFGVPRFGVPGFGVPPLGGGSSNCHNPADSGISPAKAGTPNYDVRLRPAIGWLLWLPLLVPGVLLGLVLIIIFNRSWSFLFYQSAGIVVLAFVLRYLALGWNTVAYGAERADRDLVDVARIEGANRWQMLRHAYWPQIAPQVAAAWYIIFLLCLWDVESIILIVPPRISETLALRIFNFLHYGHNAQVNALCLTLLVVALLPLALWQTVRGLQSARRVFPILRSAAPQPACNAVLIAVAALIISGCTPKNFSGAALESKLFSDIKIIGTRGVGVGQLNKPRSVAVDSQDNLYVVDMTGRVQKFSSNGVFVLSWQMPQTDLGKPKGMCRDRAGNIVVVEPHYSRVNFFSPLGKLLWQFGPKGTNDGQFSVPRAVGIDSKNEMFVTEYLQNERVQKFLLEAPANASPANTNIAKWISTIGKPGTGPGEFNRPEGLCVDTQDRVYVADSCNHRIQIFSSEGTFLRAHGKAGKGLGELSYPYDICVDHAGRQYVCEFGNSRIQVFDPNDQPIEIIGGPGAEPGRFSNPWGVALDSAENLYVADSQNHRVQKLIAKPEARMATEVEIRNPRADCKSPRSDECDFAKFPSPLPSPEGRGGIIASLPRKPTIPALGKSDLCCSLSLRERVRVRGIWLAFALGCGFFNCSPKASTNVQNVPPCEVSSLWFSDLALVSDFEFRISDFRKHWG